LLANLADAIRPLVDAIEAHAAAQSDVLQLLDAVPPLVAVSRYGNVRETDVGLVGEILDTLVPRLFIGVVPAATHIDADAARELWKRMIATDQALGVLGNQAFSQGWQDCLARLTRSEATHPLLAGYAFRLLYDARVVEFEAVARALSQALSPGNAPEVGAAWIEGLLSGSGTLLIHDDRLRSVVDTWVREVSNEHFVKVLPLLRRTFARFPYGERRVLGERLRGRSAGEAGIGVASIGEVDAQAVRALVPVLALIWSEEPAS
jgi:hypothetical protein